jgi:hypothetical protein
MCCIHHGIDAFESGFAAEKYVDPVLIKHSDRRPPPRSSAIDNKYNDNMSTPPPPPIAILQPADIVVADAGPWRDVRIAFATSGFLGLFGSLFIIISYILFPKLRTYNKLLVLLLSIADVGKSTSAILSLFYFIPGMETNDRSPLCYTQAIGIEYFELSGFLWPAIIATHLYLAVCRKYTQHALRRLLPVYLGVGYGAPLAFVIGILALNVVGTGNPDNVISWCWISSEHSWIRLLVYYLPMVALWVYNIVLYYLVSRQINQIMSFAYRKVIIKLGLYVLVLVITDLPALINRVQNLFAPHHPVVVLYFMQAIAVPLQGFFNALVYGLNKQLRNEYLACCCRKPGVVTGQIDEDVKIEARGGLSGSGGGTTGSLGDEIEHADELSPESSLTGGPIRRYYGSSSPGGGGGLLSHSPGSEDFVVKVPRFD